MTRSDCLHSTAVRAVQDTDGPLVPRRDRVAEFLAARPESVSVSSLASDEAKAAYAAACREEAVRSAVILEGYADLKRTAVEWWTADSLSEAMETGEITPAECARLYPRATERELRLSEIDHELNLGALHALAFADSYPLPASSDGTEPDDTQLLRVGRLFEAARVREMAACEACNAATKEARNHMPDRPAALLYRASDDALYLHKYHTSPEYLDGREIKSEDVAWVSRRRHTRDVRRPVRPEDNLPSDAQFIVGREPWPEAQARADEIVAAWDAWHAERDAVYAAHDLPRLDGVADKAGDVTVVLAERLAAIPAHTADGFRLKLRALAFYRRGVLDAELDEVSDPDQVLSHSLWRDVQGELPEAASAGDPDLVLALIAESHRAEEAANKWHAAEEGAAKPDTSYHAAVLFERQDAARSAVLSTMPTTHDGLKAFADFVGYQASLTYGSDWRAKIKQEMGGDLLVALCAAVETVEAK